VDAVLPPVLVQRSDMTIIDGFHRYLATRMKGDQRIRVVYFDGSVEDAELEAIRANVAHGKPLTLAERHHAADAILEHHHNLSDRSIAEICGLSPKTVARHRANLGARARYESERRLGRDGKVRRLPSLNGRTKGTRVTGEQQAPPPVGAPTSAQPERIWVADRALGSITNGGTFTNWLVGSDITSQSWEPFVAEVPISRVYVLIDEAKRRADEWGRFAATLLGRVNDA
jgi:AraC-like DNA-binding protein